MIFNWWRKRRRRQILAQPFPADWERLLQQNVRQYARLNEREQLKLRQSVQIFVNEKYWEGCQGLALTDEIRVTIAGFACLLLLGFHYDCFDRLQTLLVYPDEYFARQTTHEPGGVVSESMSMRLGEAWQRGPVILAWSSIQRDISHPQSGHNVVLHEFAHVLDMRNLDIDGTPPLADSGQYQNWNAVMTVEHQRLIDDTQQGRATLIDQYGATSPAEFFAVATECFFELPVELKYEHQRLYGILQGFYRQNPAARMTRNFLKTEN